MGKWDHRMLALAEHIATWSKDPSTQVGAVITDDRHRIVSTGYNGLPMGVADSQEILEDRNTKLAITIHAEENAILFATQALDGCTIYVSAPVCAGCAAKIVQTGIRRVVVRDPGFEMLRRWKDSFILAKVLCRDAGITYDGFHLPTPNQK